MTFIKKYIKVIFLIFIFFMLIITAGAAATVNMFSSAVVCLSGEDGEPLEGAMAEGVSDFLTYNEIEYCVYISENHGIPASILISQIILNKETAGESYDVFLRGKQYESVEGAISEYEKLLNSGSYSKLKLLESAEDWAKGLYTYDIVVDSSYPDKLIDVIDSYNLKRFDGITVSGLQKALSEGDGIAEGTFTWPLPVKGVLTSPFSSGRQHPVYGYVRPHTGQDIAANMGTAILAADGGVVEFSGWMNSDGGYTVIISHGNNMKTMYCHIMEGGLMVTKGQKVSKGQQIARVGSTGASTGAHLHFSVMVGGNYIDPLGYVKQPY